MAAASYVPRSRPPRERSPLPRPLPRARWAPHERCCAACQVLSMRPRIIYYPNFISDEDIDIILAKGGPMLKPSRTDAGLKQEVRSSIATFFTPEDEMAVPAIAQLKQRAFDVTKLPFENQEELQMQRCARPIPTPRHCTAGIRCDAYTAVPAHARAANT